MAVNPNEDTEFNDALRKHGILPPREKTPPTPSPPPSPTFDDLLNDFTPSELRELGEDAPDEETQRAIAAYRRQRLEEEKTFEKRARFGRVYPISRDDYTREVTEASQEDEPEDEDEQGTGVVCFLYKDGIPHSDRAFAHIRTLAARYPRTKFVSIVGDKCIPNLPDSRIPMIIIYKKGDIKNQLIAWGANQERRIEELEAVLLMCGAVHPLERPQGSKRDDNLSDDEEDEDAWSRIRGSDKSKNAPRKKNIRNAEDSGSDFEFDL